MSYIYIRKAALSNTQYFLFNNNIRVFDNQQSDFLRELQFYGGKSSLRDQKKFSYVVHTFVLERAALKISGISTQFFFRFSSQ